MMHARAVHTRLALLALVVVLAAVTVGVFAFRRSSAQADAVSHTAGLVATSLDDQALMVALQDERWQSIRDGDVGGAQAATDALIAVRAFDAETLELIDAARAPDAGGGYGRVIDRLLDRSGHVDPELLDGADSAKASVNVDLLHWRQALIDELEIAVARNGQAALDEARSTTNDWTTTLRLSAAPGQAEALESATGPDVLTAHRATVDEAGAGERSLVATQVWNEAHPSTATIVAAADTEIWDQLVSDRESARRQARLVPVIVAGATLVALLGLFWVARRWPSPTAIDPDEVSLDTLVASESDREEGDVEATVPPAHEDSGNDPPPGPDPEPIPTEPTVEPIFADSATAAPMRVAATSDNLFADELTPGASTSDASTGRTPGDHTFGRRTAADEIAVAEVFADDDEASSGRAADDQHVAVLVERAVATCLRPGDVVVDMVDDGTVAAALTADLRETVGALVDSALAHGRPNEPVTVIGTGHELGYLIWIVDHSAGIDDERRITLSAALGGELADHNRSTLLTRLLAVGERAGESGTDIELFADDDGGNLARVFVPARHLVTAAEPADDPISDPDHGVAAPTLVIADLADPLQAMTGERLSARLARQRPQLVVPDGTRAATVPDERPVRVPRPARTTAKTNPSAGSWPAGALGPIGLGDGDDPAEMSDAERRAAVVRRMVEQYRGGVGAALMDAADDIAAPRPAGES